MLHRLVVDNKKRFSFLRVSVILGLKFSEINLRQNCKRIGYVSMLNALFQALAFTCFNIVVKPRPGPHSNVRG